MGPSPLVAAVRSAVRVVLNGERVIVACSGGADSVALAAAVAFEAPRAGVPAGLVTIDHGLQDGSAARAQAVAGLAHELGFDPVEIVPVTVGASGGPEAAARDARYAALDAVAEALDASVLLGHTLDDQAETVLLGLGRGSGPRSLAGMQVRDGRHVRPLLGLRRATTTAACEALGLPVWHDPHNADRSFTRVRLRHDVLPVLETALQGGVSEALARTGDLLRDDLDALDAWADSVLTASLCQPAQVINSPGVAAGRGSERVDHVERDRRDGELDVETLAQLPRAVRTRVLRRWAAAAGAQPLSAERTAAVDALVTAWHGQGPVQLPGRIVVRRASGTLTASPSDALQEPRVDE